MKRHQALIPISREHHQMLMLAQLLKKDAPEYRSLPTSPEGKLVYASNEYESMIKIHLDRDALLLYPFLREYNTFEVTVQELQQSVVRLKQYFEKLSTLDSDSVHALGVDLEKYVRIKERELFQEMQQYLGEDDFTKLSDKLSKI